MDSDAIGRRGTARHFFEGAAYAIAAVVFAGFAPTFYLSGAFNGPALTPLAQIHGVVFTGWIVLLLAQTRLAAGGRIVTHRQLGTLGAVLAAVMTVVGVATGLAAAARGHAPGGGDPRSFLIIPLAAIVVFAVTVAIAVARRRQSDVHKRLMLVANISLLDPAIARLPLAIMAVHPLVSFGLACLLGVALAIYDLATLGRVHRSTLIAVPLTAASQPIALYLSETEGWLRIADMLIGWWAALG
jgi:hypothetical protein